MVMVVRRMRVIGAIRVQGAFGVRQVARGEICRPTAARGVPEGYGSAED